MHSVIVVAPAAGAALPQPDNGGHRGRAGGWALCPLRCSAVPSHSSALALGRNMLSAFVHVPWRLSDVHGPSATSG